MMRREEFFQFVENYIKTDPEAAALLHFSVQEGLNASLKEALQRAADMEVVAATLAGRKYKGSDELIKSKLISLKGATALNWDWLTDAD